MAFKLAEAFVELNAKGFSGVAQAIDRTTSGFVGMGSQMSRVSGMIPGMAAALGALGAGASVAGMVSMAAQAEQTAISFEVLLGSAETAKTMIQQLEQMGADTPFDFPGLSNAANTLLSFQVHAQDVVPAVARLSDIAAGSDQKLQSLALVFGQVASAGRLTGQDLLQFINVGFNPLNEIAKRTGESMEQLRDRMSAGKVSFSEVRQAVIDATSAGGQYYQMNLRQSATLAGRWSTLKDEIGRSLRGIGEGIVESFDLKGAVQNLTSFAQVFQTTIVPWLTAGADSAMTFAMALGNWGSILTGVASGLVAIKAAQLAFNAAVVAYQVYQKGMITGEAILAALRQNWIGLAAAGVIGLGTYLGVSHQLNSTLKDVQGATAAASVDTAELTNQIRSAGDATKQHAAMTQMLMDLESQKSGMGAMEYDFRRKQILDAAKAAARPDAKNASEFSPAPVATAQDSKEVKSLADQIRKASEELSVLRGEATQTQITLQRLWDEGADPGEVQQLSSILQQVDAAKRMKEEREALEREVDELRRSTQTKGQQLAAELSQISNLMAKGLLTPQEAGQAREEAKKKVLGELIPQSEMEAARQKIDELKTLFKEGAISREEFLKGVENAKPAKVQSLLDGLKTPIEKYKEAMDELKAFRDEGFINDEQLAKAQKKLNDQFEAEHQRRMGITSAGQRWAQIQTSMLSKSSSISSELEKSISREGKPGLSFAGPPENPAKSAASGAGSLSKSGLPGNGKAMERTAIALERIAEQAVGAGQGLKVRYGNGAAIAG